MKHLIISLLMAALMLTGCSPEAPTSPDTDAPSQEKVPGRYLTLDTTITHIATGKGRAALLSGDGPEFDEDDEGGKIIGVLLQFHDAEREMFGFTPSDPHAFYLRELKTPLLYDDGSPFANYVLMVPEVIRDVYREGGGFAPDTGNPFWWYMYTYYGMSLGEVTKDWEEALEILLENKVRLTYPEKDDVEGYWSDREQRFWDRITRFYGTDTERIGSELHTKGFFYATKAGSSPKLGDWEPGTLFLPDGIFREYRAAGGNVDAPVLAMLWYLERYQGKTDEELWDMLTEGTFKEWIESIDYAASPADGKDLRLTHPERVSDDLDTDAEALTIAHVSFFYPGSILDQETGEAAAAEEIHYNVYRSKKDGMFMDIWMPHSIEKAFEEDEMKPFSNLWDWYLFRYRHLTEEQIRARWRSPVPVKDLMKDLVIPDNH